MDEYLFRKRNSFSKSMILTFLAIYKSTKEYIIPAFFLKQNKEVIGLDEFILLQNSKPINYINISVACFLILFFLLDLKNDFRTGIIFITENGYLTLGFLTWPIFFAGICNMTEKSYLTTILTVLSGFNPAFIDNMIFDPFINFFLFVFLIFKECTSGKQLERIIMRYAWVDYFILNLMFSTCSILLTICYYSDRMDNNINLAIRYFSLFFILLVGYNRCQSFLIIYFIFISGIFLTFTLEKILFFRF